MCLPAPKMPAPTILPPPVAPPPPPPPAAATAQTVQQATPASAKAPSSAVNPFRIDRTGGGNSGSGLNIPM